MDAGLTRRDTLSLVFPIGHELLRYNHYMILFIIDT